MEKKYVNGMIFKEKTFDNGGTLLRLSVKVSDFIEELRTMQDNGWANIIIARRKEPSDTGITHYAYQDEWSQRKITMILMILNKIKKIQRIYHFN